MSANDPTPEQPAEPQPPESTPADEAILGPSRDYQRLPPATEGERPPLPPGWQPELGLPTRPIVQRPRWPHPNFWWSWLWCLAFLFITQIPGGILAVLIAVGLAAMAPEKFPMGNLSNQAALLKSDAMSVGLAIGFFVIESMVVGVSLLVIRLVLGRDWTRQLALRRPSLTHTVLALASLPALMLLGNVAYTVLRKLLRMPSISDTGVLDVAVFWMSHLVVLGVMLLMIRLIAGRDWTKRLDSCSPRFVQGLITLAGVTLVILLTNFLYRGLYEVLGLQGSSGPKLGGMEEMIEVASKWPWGFAVLVIGLGPGIGEELWCRGFLGRGLVGNYGVVLGVLASSFFFGLIHIDPCQGTMAMLMGLWLHFVYLTSRSLWLPMLLHFLNNSVGVIAPRFSQLEFLDAKPEDIPALVYAACGLLLAAVAYALYQSRARLEAEAPEQFLTWRPAYDGVEYPPSHSGTRVVHPLLSLPVSALAAGSFFVFVAACVMWITSAVPLLLR